MKCQAELVKNNNAESPTSSNETVDPFARFIGVRVPVPPSVLLATDFPTRSDRLQRAHIRDETQRYCPTTTQLKIFVFAT